MKYLRYLLTLNEDYKPYYKVDIVDKCTLVKNNRYVERTIRCKY